MVAPGKKYMIHVKFFSNQEIILWRDVDHLFAKDI